MWPRLSHACHPPLSGPARGGRQRGAASTIVAHRHLARPPMNVSEAILRELVESGVEACFANPGTSEMHLVASFDRVGGLRPILGLFEGVCTGAADGYARMKDKPAATLLHLGPGLGNGFANLHNAKRAHSRIINIVGDHATYHRKYDE